MILEIRHREPVKADDMGATIQAVSDTFRATLAAKVGQSKADWNKDPKSAQLMMTWERTTATSQVPFMVVKTLRGRGAAWFETIANVRKRRI